LNVGEQNYLAALRNALTGGALAARTGVEQRGQAVTGGIEEQYAVAARELARQRRAEQAAADAARQEAMLRAAQARAEAEGYSPSPAPKREEQQPAATETPEEVARRKALERLAEGILRGELQQFA
jgi:sRNA-binding protein